MDNTHYYLGFNMVNGIGPVRLDRLIEYCGSLEAAWHADLLQLPAAGLDAKTSNALLAARRTLDLEAERQRVEQAGIQLITRDDDNYPAALAQIPAPPPLLYVRGQISAVDDWSIAVVGTRSPTTYGREVTRRIVGELAAAGVTIVSGLAMGIDAIAHATALEVGGRTLAVLGSGLDQVYPRAQPRPGRAGRGQRRADIGVPAGHQADAATLPRAQSDHQRPGAGHAGGRGWRNAAAR